MKQHIQTLLLLVMMVTATQSIRAQHAAWVPDKGYWVTETTKSNPRHTIVHYYTDNGVLIYTETIDGVIVNINRYKVKMQLKQHLQQAVTAWENGHPLQDTANIAWNTAGKKNKHLLLRGS